MNALLFTALIGASPAAAENIDKLFEKAAALEKDGDCTGAHDVYTDITGLTSGLPVADKKRIDAQVKSRQARNKQCVEACSISDKDKKMFETVKQAQNDGELKRVAEMCKVLMHGKNAKCPAFAEIRNFCPVLGENGDPCGVSAETAAELDKLQKDVDALEKRTSRAAYAVKKDNPTGIDAVSSANREIDETYERLFNLRERYFACDKVYGGLKTQAGTLNKSRGTLRVALAKGYKVKLDKLQEDLDALQKSKEEVDAKVEKLTQFTNDVALDVMSLAQTESIRSSVKIEGVAQNNAEQLAKVLQGDRQAMEQMIKANPTHFEGDGRTALLRKKDSLERLDGLLSKLGDQGYGERLGFKTAQQEVKATLALVNTVIPPEGQEHASSFPWVPVSIGGAVLLALGAFFLLRKKGGEPAPTSSLSLSSRRPKPTAPAATRTPAAPAASPQKGGAPRKGGMLGLSANKNQAPKSAMTSAATAPKEAPMQVETTEPSANDIAAAARQAREQESAERQARELKEAAEREAKEAAAAEQLAAQQVAAHQLAAQRAAQEAKAADEAKAAAEAAKVKEAPKGPPAAAKPAQQRPGIKLLSRR